MRIHDAAMQEYIFTNILRVCVPDSFRVPLPRPVNIHLTSLDIQLSKTEKAPFDQLLRALQCGAPPHGGIALGTSRFTHQILYLPSSWKFFLFRNIGVFIFHCSYSAFRIRPHNGDTLSDTVHPRRYRVPQNSFRH